MFEWFEGFNFMWVALANRAVSPLNSISRKFVHPPLLHKALFAANAKILLFFL
jgi:hypothetical protein